MDQIDDRLPSKFPTSPKWSKSTKLFVTACVLIFSVTLLVIFRQLALYVLLALVFSLVIRPIVDYVDERLPKVPRWLATLLIYLLVFGSLFAVPISRIPRWMSQVAEFLNDFPNLLERSVDSFSTLFNEPILILGGRFMIPINEIEVSLLQQYLVDFVSFVGGGMTSFINSFVVVVTTGAIGFISSTVLVLFLSFYFTKDGHLFTKRILRLTPDPYYSDMRFMLTRASLIWGAFLRGQLILMLTIGIITFIVASILGLPNPVALAIVAGTMEIVPYAGPLLAAIPALLIAWFQNDASWLGVLIGPVWFTILTGFSYWLIQQLENYLLLPRIMGHQLKLHPAFVFVAALAGWQIAGIFGIFLAAPVLATMKLVSAFIYGKLTDQAVRDMVVIENDENGEGDRDLISAETSPSQTT